MINTKRSRKKINGLYKELPTLKEYVKNKLKDKNKESKLIDNYLDYKATRKELNKINKIKQLKNKKYKKNKYMTINEIGESSKDFYKEKNIYEWTKKNWSFQKKSMLEMSNKISKDKIKNLEGVDFLNKIKIEKNINNEKNIELYGENYDKLYLYATWIRWIESNRIEYGAISSIEDLIREKIEKKSSKWIDKKIPNLIISKFNKIKDSKYTSLDLETRANGKEKEYEKIKANLYEFQSSFVKLIYDDVINELKDKVFVKETYDNQDPFTTIYIPDLETSKKISTKNFMNDIELMKQPFGVVKNTLRKIMKKYKFKNKLKKLYKDSINEKN
jgi:hypothetical protein